MANNPDSFTPDEIEGLKIENARKRKRTKKLISQAEYNIEPDGLIEE